MNEERESRLGKIRPLLRKSRPLLLDSRLVTPAPRAPLQPTEPVLPCPPLLPWPVFCPFLGRPPSLLPSFLPLPVCSSFPPDRSRLPPSLVGLPSVSLALSVLACPPPGETQGPSSATPEQEPRKHSEMAEELELRVGWLWRHSVPRQDRPPPDLSSDSSSDLPWTSVSSFVK